MASEALMYVNNQYFMKRRPKLTSVIYVTLDKYGSALKGASVEPSLSKTVLHRNNTICMLKLETDGGVIVLLCSS